MKVLKEHSKKSQMQVELCDCSLGSIEPEPSDSKSFFLVPLSQFVLSIYRVILRPFMGRSCKFHPTCSHYFEESVRLHGFYGLWLSIVRIFKCHPFHPGGYDPVPTNESLFDGR